MTAATFVDYYALLQIPETATADEITTAIRTARRTWTKRQAASNPERRQEAEQKVREITEAERILKDPSGRSAFDRDRANWRPTTPTAGGGDENRNWSVLAREYLRGQNPHSANYAAREALALNGADHESWWVRAHSSFLMGRPADSEYEFNEAIRLQPQNAEYHFDLAEAFATQAKWKQALSEYETALSIDPGNPVYKTGIANAYLVNKDPERALALMEEVVAAHPADVFQYYLAVAIHDVTVRKWSKLRNGSFGITSEAQIAYTLQVTDRALGLKFDDDHLRARLKENRDIALHAQEMKWVHSSNVVWYLGGLLVTLGMLGAIASAPLVGLIGLALLGGIPWAYWTRHYKPNWKHLVDAGAVVKAGL